MHPLRLRYVLRLPCFLNKSFVLMLATLFVLRSSHAETPYMISMQAAQWVSNGNATFTPGAQDGDAILEISKGSVQVKDLAFTDATIEFDMFMPDHGILGMRFRAQDRENAEALFFRPQKDCSAAPDCFQYMPLEHGAYEWDLFPEYQSTAAIHTLAWNHFRVVVAGRTLQVYLNHASRPALVVEHMEGPALPGTIIFNGPARYAHLMVTPAPAPIAGAPVAADRNDGSLLHWQISAASVLPSVHDAALDAPTGVPPAYAAMPAAGAAWKNVTAQAKGLINFPHEIGSSPDAGAISLAWAKTDIVSDQAQTKTVQIGWVREIWVYVNGTLVYTDRNLGDLPAARVDEQRINLGNGTFRLPLRAGHNEIAIALDDNLPGNKQHYGWGMMMQLDDMHGVSMMPTQ